ncbi:glycosyl hydrolase [Aspergillus californicus]
MNILKKHMPLLLAALTIMSSLARAKNITYTNPILPGWHSDPSCIFVAEENNTFFCATSSFLTFPGIPIYASKDLLHWKLISHVVTRPSQVPELIASAANLENQTQQDGLWAPTIRYRDGRFYLLTSFVSMVPDFSFTGLLFMTDDIFSLKNQSGSAKDTWSDPLVFQIGDIDPDIFWDTDFPSTNKVHITYAGISQTTLDLSTGLTTPPTALWTGTGAGLPEGPHIYLKDNWYYLCIGEGGTELGHQQSIARSRNVSGPYEGYAANPVLTNKGTDEYLQTVGHADLFQDARGQWWGVALATRSGAEWRVYPMGRETVLFPVSWEEGAWPVLGAVKGRMEGWSLPVLGEEEGWGIPGEGAFVDGNDDLDFAPGTGIPSHFLFWRVPGDGIAVVSPPERAFSLRLVPSRLNITGRGAEETGTAGSSITLVTRRQSHTYFTYSVDVSFAPSEEGEEVGVSVFLTQLQHIDLGIVLLPSSGKKEELVPHIRFRPTLLDDLNTQATQNVTIPETIVRPLSSQSWLLSSKKKKKKEEITARLQIQALDDTHYTLSVLVPGSSHGHSSEGSFDKPVFEKTAETVLVSGGTGRFTGVLLGAYATSNGGSGSTPAYITRWRYKGHGQKIE